MKKFGEEGDQDVIWALNGVSFDVKHGEVIGIVGHNGAGKSMPLKSLSKITEPPRVGLSSRGGGQATGTWRRTEWYQNNRAWASKIETG